MIQVIGWLLNNRSDQTRLYEVPEKNFYMHVCYSFDTQYVASEEKLDVPGVYLLLWPPNDKGRRDIYIGQTTSLSRRFREHVRMRDFECACMFSTINGRLSKTEILYLEYTTIVSAMEYGNVNLMENYQIPAMPDIGLEDMKKMDEFFDTMRLIMSYAGYGQIFEKVYMHLREAGSGTQMMKRLVNTQQQNEPVYRGSALFDDSYGVDDEDRVLVSYEVKGNGYSAQVIPMKGDSGYFIMPNSKVAPYVCLDNLNESARDSVETSTRSFPRGLMTDSLASAAEAITGRCDASVWTMTRTIV